MLIPGKLYKIKKIIKNFDITFWQLSSNNFHFWEPSPMGENVIIMYIGPETWKNVSLHRILWKGKVGFLEKNECDFQEIINTNIKF